MDRKLFGLFSGSHLTVMFAVAVIAPSALYGAVATQAVTPTDPSTGYQALVDGGRRMWVYDPIAGYANNPYYSVRILAQCYSGNCSSPYSPPSGKALIVKAIDFFYYAGAAGSDNYMYVQSSHGIVAGVESVDSSGQKNSNLGNGYFIKNGEALFYSFSGTGVYYASIVGYLIPASLAPPSVAQGPDPQSVEPSALMIKGRRMLR